MGISRGADKKLDGISVKSERVYRRLDVGSDQYLLRTVAKEKLHRLTEPRKGQGKTTF